MEKDRSVEKPTLNSTRFKTSSEHTIQIINETDSVITVADDGKNLVSTLPVKPQERYKFIRSIGFGGMKGVLLVHDNDTGRDVAMAMMPDFRNRPQRDLNRFVREAKITAKLEHPNIVPVYDIGVDGSGSPFFVMKHLHGKTLATILHNRHHKGHDDNYPLDRLLQILIRICNAVAFAHSKGVCHLDLKPANVICGDYGEVQVIDWGLAAAGDSDFDSGLLQGTPGYMSPEFIRSKGKQRPGEAADIYAIGAILYAILANETPYTGLSQQEILHRQVAGIIPPPSEKNSQVDYGLEAICMKALAVDPEERYRTVLEMRMDIFNCLDGYPAKAEEPSFFRHLLLYAKRKWMMLTLLLLAILVAVMAILLMLNK